MHYHEAIERLERALSRPLPGSKAHDILSPRPRRQWPEGFHPSRIRDAAGLLLVFPVADRAHLVLTVRAGTLERHGGQVSLPGGVVDPGETFDRAALREAHEEVALSLSGVRVLGGLTPLDIPVSGFRLHPVLAAVGTRPRLRPAEDEVANILEVAVDDLLNPAHLRSTDRERDGRRLEVPAFFVAGHEIWGATAMVLAEFLTLLGWPGEF
jgi:8-oxo-dGTP pyrophosphatase MutT (NUDIX family)